MFRMSNRKEYKSKCIMFTATLACVVILVCVMLYESLLKEDPQGVGLLIIGVLSAAVFAALQLSAMYRILNAPKGEEKSYTREELIRDWAWTCGVAFGAVFALVMIIGTAANDSLGEAFLGIILGSPCLGAVMGCLASVLARWMAPNGYTP